MAKPVAVRVHGRPIDADTIRAVAKELERLATLVERESVVITADSGILVTPQCDCGLLHCSNPGSMRLELHYTKKETCH